MTLTDKLAEYAESGALPMHMPGHKRNERDFPWLRGLAGLDITEIHGFDNLNDPEGLFCGLERRAAALWGAGESVALVNGSTVGLMAAVLSTLEGGGELLLCRDSHRCVYHAAQLGKNRTRYLAPARDPELGIPLSVTAGEVETALKAFPDVRLVCVTSPTYEGVVSDVAAIAGVCHAHGVPLLVDEAHGAHLGFGGFPVSAVSLGADLVVQSLHKTLPSLTQTALLHINPGLADPGRVRRYIAMLQTSSPSYLLSSSIDGCVDYLEREGDAAANRWLSALQAFREETAGLENIRLWAGAEGVFALDPSKILISANGLWLSETLRERYGVELEYACRSHALAMTGMGDTEMSLSRLAAALRALDKEAVPREGGSASPTGVPRQVLPTHEAAALPGSLVPVEETPGRVAGEYIWSYPPGVPLLVPGEEVSAETVRAVKSADNLHSDRKAAPDLIFCVDLR